MKLKFVKILTLVFFITSINSFAHDFEVDGIYYNIISSTDKTVKVTYKGSHYGDYIEYTGSVTIPETVTYSGTIYSITSIGDYAFCECNGLTSITIPNSVTEISDIAFNGCSGLTSVTIPNSVTSIGNSAFCACNGLTSITIPNSVTEISNGAFADCRGLKSATIGNSVTSIGAYAFFGCSGLTSITIPNSVTSIGNYAFNKCSGLKSVTIGNSVTSIGKEAFYYCSGLTEVNITDLSAWCKIDFESYDSNPLYYANHLKMNGTEITNLIIPDGITEIKNCTFSNCIGLTSVIIPNSVTEIGEYAFRGCSGLTEVNYNAENCTSMGSYDYPVFKGCTNLKTVNIGSSVEIIPNYAFCGCSGLTSVAIPNSVSSIGDGAFSSCSGLTSITIPNSVTSIGTTAFAYCSGLIEVNYNAENCTSMGSYNYPVFKGCTNLKTLNIGNSVKTIPNSAFFGCSGLTSITIPNSVTSIGNYAFNKCSGLTSVTIGSGVLSIGTSAFEDLDIKKVIWLTNTPPQGYETVAGEVNYVANNRYSDLSNVTIYPYLSSLFEVDGIKYVPVSPSERTCDALDCSYETTISDTNIGKTVSFKGIEMNIKAVKPYTFYDNINITKATIDSEFNGSIGDYAFAYCNKIDEIILPDGVTSLGGSAFEGCSSLASVEIGSGISSIKEKTFYGCSSLTAITIPANVTSIGNYVFDNCSSLEELIITDRETELSLGSNGSNPLFSDCPLKSVYVGGNITYPTSSGKGYSPFYRNTSLETVIITDKETEISENEFYGCTALKTVSMGDGVETIGNWAFSGCSSLDFFSFGSGMKTIGTEAFSDCTAMTKLYSKAIVPPTCGSQALDDINKWNCELYVPQASIADYQAADQWKEFFFIKDIESGVEEVLVDGEDYSNAPIEFYNLSGLKVGDSTENLAPGVYIKRQGRKVEKIAIQ